MLARGAAPHQQICATLLPDDALDPVIEDESPRHLLHGPEAPDHADAAVALFYLYRAGFGAERQRFALRLGPYDLDAICPADRNLPKYFTKGSALEPEDDCFGDVEVSVRQHSNGRVETTVTVRAA